MRKSTLFAAVALCGLLSVHAQERYEMGNPKDPANYGYLSEYSALKDYVDRTKYPNFKLGAGTTVSDYLGKGIAYRMINANFHETVAGNAMKQASCVRNDGSMDFTQVKRYVTEATRSGLVVYGHTLAWHSQQANGWLRGLIKDQPADELTDGDVDMLTTIATKDFRSQQSVGWHSSESDFGYTLTYDGTNGLRVHTTRRTPNSWDVQYVAMDNIPTEAGGSYVMTMTVRGTSSGKIHSKLGDWGGGSTADIPFTTEWQDVQIEYKNTLANSFLLLQNGDFVGDIYIRQISFARHTKGKTINEDRRCIEVKATDKVEEAWDNQFWIMTGNFPANAQYEFSAEVRADKAAKATTQIHTEPGSYVHYAGVGDVYFSPEWKTVHASGRFEKAGSSIAFNLSELASANNYYFDNISLKVNGVERVKNGTLDGTDVSSFYTKVSRGAALPSEITDHVTYIYVPGPKPLSQQQRHDTLVWAMDKWIKGMLEACDGKVKAWDVVNEAISGGGDDGQGNYTLQHSDGYWGGSWDVGGDAFYWQDHMGDLEYVRQAIRLARKYGPEDIKLFINDYNLESDWDSNKKLKSLINWIKKWEADGVTHVDGIGTQMHISYYENSGTQTSKKNAITNMFRLMAATGKLVRVSEFDMGYVNASGKDVPTSQMTEQQHKNMADYYEWIVRQYLTIIPVAQQWGMCWWCPTDSPANSGWRANTPVGIWTLDYYRKHAYAGIVRGLGGVAMSVDQIAEDEDEATADAPIYDIRGQRLDAASVADLPAGLYIVGGRKVMKP